MILMISLIVILASLLAILSGIWVMAGLVAELANPSEIGSSSEQADISA